MTPITDVRTIAIEECYFSKVPEDEILTCYYYEYARAREDIRALVSDWREKLKDLPRAFALANTPEARRERRESWIQYNREPREDRADEWNDSTFENEESAVRAYWHELAELTDRTFAQLLLNLPGFPDTPWQTIEASLRTRFKGLLPMMYVSLEEWRGGIREEPWKDVFNRARSGSFRDYNVREGEEIVAFCVDWRGGVEKLIDAFAEWARKRNPAAKTGRKKKPRDVRYEHLKQLGVVRLKLALGNWKAVQKHSCKASGCDLYGSDHAVWSKARSAALKRVETLFPIREAER